MRLADYSSDEHCFEFDPRSGGHSRVTLAAPRTGLAGYAGMGQMLRSPREGRVLVAKYLLDGDAWFSIGAGKWRLFDAALTPRHRARCGGLLCELSLHQDGRCIRMFRYLRRDWLASVVDPAYDYLDFSLANLPVDLVPHESSSLDKQRADFIALWSGTPGSAGSADRR